MIVWILESGSVHEGGRVLGVYAEPALAHPDFTREAGQLLQTAAVFNAKFNPHKDPVDAEKGEDGSLRLYAAGDYVTLTPHDVVTSARPTPCIRLPHPGRSGGTPRTGGVVNRVWITTR